MEEVKPVQLLTVKSIQPLFKDAEEANAIELINLEEVGFDLVAGKGLYGVNDKVIYIQPDYCLSDIPLFESFIRPINRKTNEPDENSSMLGKVNGKPRRIRAKKFNLSKEPNGEPVYSNGVLLPITEVQNYLVNTGNWNKLKSDWSNITELLGITKYEEPEKNSGNVKTGASKPWPGNVYKTDEVNIHNCWGKLEFPVQLVGTEKIDGSSITLGVINGEPIICSRNLRKPLTYMKVVGHRKPTFIERVRMFFTKWKPDLKIREEVENLDDDFVKHGKPYIIALQQYPETINNVLLRGELNGGNLKGSGNKHNPARLEKPNIKFFGIDFINDAGFAEKKSHSLLKEFCNSMNTEPVHREHFPEFNTVKEVFNREFESKEDLLNTCKEYFKENMIEGIVVKTTDSKFSAKVMNDEYDSKK